VLRILEVRRLAPSREQIMSCTDVAQLDLWFDRAATVGTVDEVFAER
jgi:hypothetical protein